MNLYGRPASLQNTRRPCRGLHLATVEAIANAQVNGRIPQMFPPPFPPEELGASVAQAVLSDPSSPILHGLNGS